MIHAHSLEAKRACRKEIAKKEQDVLDELRRNGPGTDREIARRLGLASRQDVAPRITELKEAGLLMEIGSRREGRCRVRVVGVFL